MWMLATAEQFSVDAKGMEGELEYKVLESLYCLEIVIEALIVMTSFVAS